MRHQRERPRPLDAQLIDLGARRHDFPFQRPLGLARHLHVDQVERDADAEDRERGARQEDAAPKRRQRVHRSAKSSSAAPPSGTTTAFGFRRVALVPGDHAVVARRHVVDVVTPLAVGHREVRMAEHEDERAHVRVDVAEHAHDARPIEADRPRVTGGVASEIEAGRLRERKHVVIELVRIRKIDRRAGHDGEQMRHERFVALVHHRSAAFVDLEGASRRRLQVDHRAHPIVHVARRRRAQIGDAGPALHLRHHPPHLYPPSDHAVPCGGHRGHKGDKGHKGQQRQQHRPRLASATTAHRRRSCTGTGARKPSSVPFVSLCVLVRFFIRTRTPADQRRGFRPAAARRRRGCCADRKSSAAGCAGWSSPCRPRPASLARPTAASTSTRRDR